MSLLVGMKFEDELHEWDAKRGDTILCIIGAYTHVGYNLLSSPLDDSIFDKHSYDISIYLYDL